MFKALCKVVKNYKLFCFFIFNILIAVILINIFRDFNDEYGILIFGITFVAMLSSIGICCFLEHCADAMDYMNKNPLATKKEAWKTIKFNDDGEELFV